MKNQITTEFVTQSLEELRQSLLVGPSDHARQILTVAAKFPTYTRRNYMMIKRQRPDATRLAGIQTWRELNRWVRRGEHGIEIFAPVATSKRQSTPLRSRSEYPHRKRVTAGFRLVHVFDVSQTEGEELPQESPVLGEPEHYLDTLKEVYAELEIEIVFVNLPSGEPGFSLGGEVGIRDDLDDANQFRVLAHELAHELMHDTCEITANTTARMETEAEAVAFVVSKACGLNGLNRSADYIALSHGNANLFFESLDRIHEAAADVLNRIDAKSSLSIPQQQSSI